MSKRTRMSAHNADDMCSLYDKEFEQRLEDPSLIQTHDEAKAIIREITRSIVNIDVQIEVYGGEVAVSAEDAVSKERHGLYRKALHARMHRAREIDSVHQRDRGLRNAPTEARRQPDPGEGIARHNRLQAEAEERLAIKKLKLASIARMTAEDAARRSLRRHFIAAARENLLPEMFEMVLAAAKARQDADRKDAALSLETAA